MAPHTFQQAAHSGIASAFMLVFALIMMIAPYLISIVANIGRRPWPSYRREPAQVRSRAMLSAPPRIAA